MSESVGVSQLPVGREPLDYLGVKPCGCAVAWISAKQSRGEIAKEVSDWIRRGYDVQRVTTDEARARLDFCKHVSRPAKQEELALGVGVGEGPK